MATSGRLSNRSAAAGRSLEGQLRQANQRGRDGAGATWRIDLQMQDKDYRENFARSIFLSGKITQQTAYELSPRIKELRAASADPITLYIDSPGGSAAIAEGIRFLIKAPDQDGRRCRLITVVTGTAASAAADLLALGDYAIAEPQADILYHGSRQALDQILTIEGVSSVAANLQEANERLALRLARSSFRRIIWRVIQLKDAIEKFRVEVEGLEELVKALTTKLSPANAALLAEAIARQKALQEVKASADSYLKRLKNLDQLPDKQLEPELLRAIVNFRSRQHQDDDWLLSRTGMQEVMSDFNLIHDYASQTKDMDALLEIYGSLFLTPAQSAEFKDKSKEEQKLFLESHASGKLEALWYFIVSLCRLLQTKDYQITPEEAYWLGVVDEVTGSGLQSDREMIEMLLPVETAQLTPA
jgi:ATP-dependent protease ClpP protease subunit